MSLCVAESPSSTHPYGQKRERQRVPQQQEAGGAATTGAGERDRVRHGSAHGGPVWAAAPPSAQLSGENHGAYAPNPAPSVCLAFSSFYNCTVVTHSLWQLVWRWLCWSSLDRPCRRKTLNQCWFNVVPTLNQHWFNVLCLQGHWLSFGTLPLPVCLPLRTRAIHPMVGQCPQCWPSIGVSCSLGWSYIHISTVNVSWSGQTLAQR